MKNANDSIGNQTRDFPACIAVFSYAEEHKDYVLIRYSFLDYGIFIKLEGTWLPPFSEYNNNLLP
jgi:hypothetical protein